MLTEITTAKNALEGFASHVDSFWSPEKFHTHAHGGWNSLPLTRADLSGRLRALSARLDQVKDDDVNEDLQRKLSELPAQLAWFQDNTLPQISGGNVQIVLSNFDIILSNVEQSIPFNLLPDWEEVEKSNLIPRDLAKRLRNLESALNRLEPKAGGLESMLTAISQAHSAALDLPTDLQSLKEAREEVARHGRDAATALTELQAAVKAAKLSQDEVAKFEEESKRSVANIDAAYSAATTVGLAASFNERAEKLTRSTRNWVALLMVALIGGGVIGYVRLNAFQEMAANRIANLQILWIDALLSILSLAAPVWFAWLATRQIGQRFRLAEDYAFKASVARAYEGYRKEAARLDPELEARLFASALDRLDEQPLRFLSTEEHGSPYESLFASTGFQRMMEKVPSVREAMETALERVKPTPPAQ